MQCDVTTLELRAHPCGPFRVSSYSMMNRKKDEFSASHDRHDSPVTTPGSQPKERTGLSLGRMVNGAILFIHVATLLTSLCVIGFVGSLIREIAEFRASNPKATMLGTCPFYVGKAVGTEYYPLAPTGVCLWFIGGHTILAIAAIVFFIVGVVRIVFAMDIGFGTIAELVATPILFVLAVAVAVSISIGIPITCGNLLRPDLCSLIGFPNGIICDHTTNICWYNSAKRAESAAWVVLIFLAVFFAVSIARLVILIRRRKEVKRRRQLVEYDTADDNPPAPV